jgi:hypothetical protein
VVHSSGDLLATGLVAYPFVWLLLLPFRLLGIAVEGVFGILKAILLLPLRGNASEMIAAKFRLTTLCASHLPCVVLNH